MSGIGKQRNTIKDQSPYPVEKADLAQVAHYRVNPELCRVCTLEKTVVACTCLKDSAVQTGRSKTVSGMKSAAEEI